jgi:hypothetical protein
MRFFFFSFFSFCSGVKSSPLLLRPLLAYCTSPGWWWIMMSVGQSKPNYSKKTSTSTALFTTNPAWRNPGSITCRNLEKPAIDRLSCGTSSEKLSFLRLCETEPTWYFGHYLAYCKIPEWWLMMNVEQSVEWVAGKTEVLGVNLPHWSFVHHKSHMTWPGLEFEP